MTQDKQRKPLISVWVFTHCAAFPFFVLCCAATCSVGGGGIKQRQIFGLCQLTYDIVASPGLFKAIQSYFPVSSRDQISIFFCPVVLKMNVKRQADSFSHNLVVKKSDQRNFLATAENACESSGCWQHCFPVASSYKCDCAIGFRLNEDGHACDSG